MTRRTKLLIAVFAVVVAADLLFLAGFLKGCGPDAGPPRTGADARGVERENAVARGPAELERAAEATAGAARAPAQESALGPRRKGRVVIPAGTPEDDERVVVCGSFASDAGDPLRVPVAEDGTFEARFPPSENEFATGWVGLESRWLVLETDELVDPTELGKEIVLTPKLGACVRGVVRLPPGREDERALVQPEEIALTLTTEAGEPIDLRPQMRFLPVPGDVREASAWKLAPGPELAFETFALDADAKHELAMTNPRFVSESLPLDLAAGTETRVLLPLRAGIRVRGRVVDAAGAPVERADIAGVALGPGSETAWFEDRRTDGIHNTSTTNAQGRFDLGIDVDVPIDVLVRAVKDDALPAVWVQEAVEPGMDLASPDFVLRDARITGRVRRSDGRSVEYAVVQLLAEGDEQALEARVVLCESALVASDGTFEVSAPFDGAWTILVRDAKNAPGVAELAHVRPGTHGLDLLLIGVPDLVVDVRDDLGQPVPKAKVIVNHARNVRDIALVTGDPCTGEDGRVLIPGVPDGVWRIEVFALRHTRATIEVGILEPASRSLRVVLERTAELQGRVAAPEGEPVVSGTACLRTVGRRPGIISTTNILPTGEFHFLGLASGSYELTTSALQSGWLEPLELELAPGERRVGVELRLERGGVLEVEVLDDRGRPDAGRRVDCSTQGSNSQLVADARGRVRFAGLPPGQVVLFRSPNDSPGGSAMDWPSGLTRAQVVIARGETKHVVLGGSTAKASTLHARVRYAGKPVGDAEIRVDDDCRAGHEGRTDALGRVAIDLHGSGRATLHVWNEVVGFAWVLDPASIPADELVIDIPSNGVRGRVRSTSGATLPEALVLLASDAAGAVSTERFSPATLVDEGGAFEFRSVAPGKYVLAEFGNAGRGTPKLPVEVKDGVVEVEFVVP